MSEKKERVYTTTEKSFMRQVGRGMWIKSEFYDHGQVMVITSIGPVYKEGRVKLIDIKAVER